MREMGLKCVVSAVMLLTVAVPLLGCGDGQISATSAGTAAATATAAPVAKATATVAATDTPAATATVAATMSATLAATTTSAPGQGNADVVFVRAVQAGEGDGSLWTFHVTVSHPDKGWEDYADGWDVVTPDGQVLKPDPDSAFTRTLLHPHVEERPFTRSQSGIRIPAGVTQVRVRAHDLVDGYGGQGVVVDLEAESGERFEVEREE